MKKLLLAAAFSLFTIPAMGETPVTKWQWGCEWQQADNGDYWFRVDGGCPIHTALGYASANEMRGKDAPPATEDDSEEPSDSGDGGTDPGEGPDDDNAGPGDDGGNGGGNEGPGTEGPSKPGNGYGDNNHDHSGPPGQGGDKPGKGKGKGRR